MVAGKDVNKFPEMDMRSSLTNWPTREIIHCQLLQKTEKIPLDTYHVSK